MTRLRWWVVAFFTLIFAVAVWTRLAESKSIPPTIRAGTDAISKLFQGALK